MQLVSAMLFGVGATDPATFAQAVAVVIVASVLACTYPALRAALNSTPSH
jgi:hypothetical protein